MQDWVFRLGCFPRSFSYVDSFTTMKLFPLITEFHKLHSGQVTWSLQFTNLSKTVKLIILPPKYTDIILDYYLEIDYLKQGLEGKLIRMLKNGSRSPDQYLALAPLPGFFRVNVMYERPLSNSCEILGFFCKIWSRAEGSINAQVSDIFTK